MAYLSFISFNEYEQHTTKCLTAFRNPQVTIRKNPLRPQSCPTSQTHIAPNPVGGALKRKRVSTFEACDNCQPTSCRPHGGIPRSRSIWYRTTALLQML